MDPFFRRYCRRKTLKHFDKLTFVGEVEEKALPILLIANHMSWWDGLWLNYINARLFKRKFNFMMLEEQLRKHWYFQYIGGFSVKKGSRTVVETMNHAAELLADRQNLVLMFPQGEIHSLYSSDFIFEKGIEHILSRLDGPVQIVFVANMVDYLSKPKPGLYVYLHEYRGEDHSTKALEKGYNRFYQESLNQQKQLKE
jgi:1-acyl-sn-glycerol-3-phosphate acyltransferase